MNDIILMKYAMLINNYIEVEAPLSNLVKL